MLQEIIFCRYDRLVTIWGRIFTPQSLRDSSSINRGALQGPLAMEEPYYYSLKASNAQVSE